MNTAVAPIDAPAVSEPRLAAFLAPGCPEVFHSVATPTDAASRRTPVTCERCGLCWMPLPDDTPARLPLPDTPSLPASERDMLLHLMVVPTELVPEIQALIIRKYGA